MCAPEDISIASRKRLGFEPENRDKFSTRAAKEPRYSSHKAEFSFIIFYRIKNRAGGPCPRGTDPCLYRLPYGCVTSVQLVAVSGRLQLIMTDASDASTPTTYVWPAVVEGMMVIEDSPKAIGPVKVRSTH